MRKSDKRKIAEKIVLVAEYVAVNTVNKSNFIQIHEPDIPDEVLAYAMKKEAEKEQKQKKKT